MWKVSSLEYDTYYFRACQGQRKVQFKVTTEDLKASYISRPLCRRYAHSQKKARQKFFKNRRRGAAKGGLQSGPSRKRRFRPRREDPTVHLRERDDQERR